jgi:REP element-mobilizing transposase RayT
MSKQLYPYVPARNQRLPSEFYETVGKVCFATVRAYGKYAPFASTLQRPQGARLLNDAVIETLRTERERLRCWVHVYCLMPDHLQMMVSPNEDGYSVLTFIDQFKGKTTNLSWQFQWQGKLWQPRSYDYVVQCEEALPKIAEYILSDPVRSGLVERREDYPWCGVWDPFPV